MHLPYNLYTESAVDDGCSGNGGGSMDQQWWCGSGSSGGSGNGGDSDVWHQVMGVIICQCSHCSTN